MKVCSVCLHITLLIVAFATRVVAEEQPLWEAGLGAGVTIASDYVGSDETRVLPLPLPYIEYRSRYFKSDSDGTRLELLKNDVANFNIAAALDLPLKSEDNAARRGTSDLKAILSPGPTLAFTGWRSNDRKMQLGADLTVYLPITIEIAPRFLGPVFHPRLRFKVNDLADVPNLDLLTLVGPNFSSDQYHQYYYSVAPRFATAARPAFKAAGGYSGSTLQLALSRRTKKLYMTAAARYDYLTGAAFTDSPLFKRSSSVFIEFAVAYLFLKSERTVETNE